MIHLFEGFTPQTDHSTPLLMSCMPPKSQNGQPLVPLAIANLADEELFELRASAYDMKSYYDNPSAGQFRNIFSTCQLKHI